MLVRSPLELGHLVRDQRTQRSLTQAALAASVGVSRKWIGDLEGGKRALDLSLVLRALSVLELDVDIRARRKPATGGIELDEIIMRAGRGPS